jgi:hypothetical protein
LMAVTPVSSWLSTSASGAMYAARVRKRVIMSATVTRHERSTVGTERKVHLRARFHHAYVMTISPERVSRDLERERERERERRREPTGQTTPAAHLRHTTHRVP